MAESLIFKISILDPLETPPYYVDWFQSDDGVIWPDIPVDEIEVASLPFNSLAQTYTWTSQLADPNKYHRLITKSFDGVLSKDWQTIAPRPKVDAQYPSDFSGWTVSDGSNNSYWMGDYVELMFEVEEPLLAITGTELTVHILDFNNSIIDTLTAELISNNMFSVRYQIPKTLNKKYNLSAQTEPYIDTNLFYLKDRWILPDNTYIEFGFTVRKDYDNPVSDNSQITVQIRSIKDKNYIDNVEQEILSFTTRMNPFYCSIEDVKTLHKELLASDRIDNFDIAQEIYLTSNMIDNFIIPDEKHIYYRERLNSAVRNYARLYTAKTLLLSLLQTNNEMKKLDMFEVSRGSGNPQDFINEIDEMLNKYFGIILAGGKDTIFVTKRFEKGLSDPNRTNANRLNIDFSDPYPWVNSSTANSIININGENVEVRGQRTITFYKSRTTSGNVYLRSEGPA